MSLEDLQMIDGVWAANGNVTVQQVITPDVGDPYTLTFDLQLGLDENLFSTEITNAIEGGALFDLTAILDQEDEDEDEDEWYDEGYRLWLTSESKLFGVPELGDANGDGIVDISDLTALSGNWEDDAEDKNWAQGDFNGDKYVDIGRPDVAQRSLDPPAECPVPRRLPVSGRCGAGHNRDAGRGSCLPVGLRPVQAEVGERKRSKSNK